MITVGYRLSSSRYPANSGIGAGLHGGRWNPTGVPVIYAAMSPSLAALEILVHYETLPTNFSLTSFRIPSRVIIRKLLEHELPPRWNRKKLIRATQNLGAAWVHDGHTAVLSVPSSIIPFERNLVLNPAHPDFHFIRFSPPAPFQFDTRLKQ